MPASHCPNSDPDCESGADATLAVDANAEDIATFGNNISPGEATVKAFDEIGDSVPTRLIFAAGAGPDLSKVLASCRDKCTVHFRVKKGQFMLADISAHAGEAHSFTVIGAEDLANASAETFYKNLLIHLAKNPALLVEGTVVADADRDALLAQIRAQNDTVSALIKERDARPTQQQLDSLANEKAEIGERLAAASSDLKLVITALIRVCNDGNVDAVDSCFLQGLDLLNKKLPDVMKQLGR